MAWRVVCICWWRKIAKSQYQQNRINLLAGGSRTGTALYNVERRHLCVRWRREMRNGARRPVY